MALGFYSNNKDCYGCKTCSMACMTTRLSGQTATFLRRVDVILDGEAEAQSFLSLACNHCDEPACLANCPVGAYTKLDNGVVVQDHDLCIGCKTCISACPYGAPVFDEASSTTYKCDMCIDRLERGEKPACVEACPGGNIEQGEIDDLAKAHPDAVKEIAGITASASETKPNVLISVDPKIA